MLRFHISIIVLTVRIIQADAIDQEKYVGCFIDHPNRAMPGGFVKLDGATVDMCVDRCAGLGFLYAGLQDADSCFCADVYDKHGRAPGADECNKACPGNPAQKCGGLWRNSIWKTEAYVGCYKDTADRAMVGDYERIPEATVGKCIDRCKGKSFNYAGLQYADGCYCGNEYDKHGKSPEAECGISCPGNLIQKCGGYLRNSVWKTGN